MLAGLVFAGAVALIAGFAYVAKLTAQKKEKSLVDMGDNDYIIAVNMTMASLTNGKAAEKSKTQEFTSLGTAIATNEDLLELAVACGLEKADFDQYKECFALVYSELSSFKNYFTYVPPTYWHYEFERGPDFEKAQDALPRCVNKIEVSIDGDASTWLDSKISSQEITVTVDVFTSNNGCVEHTLTLWPIVTQNKPYDFTIVEVADFINTNQ